MQIVSIILSTTIFPVRGIYPHSFHLCPILGRLRKIGARRHLALGGAPGSGGVSGGGSNAGGVFPGQKAGFRASGGRVCVNGAGIELAAGIGSVGDDFLGLQDGGVGVLPIGDVARAVDGPVLNQDPAHAPVH